MVLREINHARQTEVVVNAVLTEWWVVYRKKSKWVKGVLWMSNRGWNFSYTLETKIQVQGWDAWNLSVAFFYQNSDGPVLTESGFLLVCITKFNKLILS